jgi:hypothetical protein
MLGISVSWACSMAQVGNSQRQFRRERQVLACATASQLSDRNFDFSAPYVSYKGDLSSTNSDGQQMPSVMGGPVLPVFHLQKVCRV